MRMSPWGMGEKIKKSMLKMSSRRDGMRGVREAERNKKHHKGVTNLTKITNKSTKIIQQINI